MGCSELEIYRVLQVEVPGYGGFQQEVIPEGDSSGRPH